MNVHVEPTEMQKRARSLELMIELVKSNALFVETLDVGKKAATAVIAGAEEFKAYLYPKKE